MDIALIAYMGTALVLVGYALNSQSRVTEAAVAWIAGDVLWIAYDIAIRNAPHILLSMIIIALNLRLLWRTHLGNRE